MPTRLILGVDGSPGARRAVRALGMRAWPAGTEVRLVVGVLSSGGVALGFIVGLMGVGRWATPLLNRLLRISSHEVFVVVVFTSLFLLAGLGETIHVAESIGALLSVVGVVVAGLIVGRRAALGGGLA